MSGVENMSTNEGGKSPDRMKNAFETNEIARLLNVDLDRSVEQLLSTAARALNSEEASILVRNSDEGNMYFLKAIGQVGDQLEGVEIPAGKGIAGFVVVSGQPMAISDVGSEESFYAEIDKKTGFSTEILLATPLFFDGEVIGVLEFINRIGDPPYDPFTPEEMDQAAIYADGIAALVNSFLASSMSTKLAASICENTVDADLTEILGWIEEFKGKQQHKEMLELAVLLKEIAHRGPAHRKLCRDLLNSILDFAGSSASYNYSDV